MQEIPVREQTKRSNRRLAKVVDGIRERGRAAAAKDDADHAAAQAKRPPVQPVDRTPAEYWAPPEGGYRPAPYEEQIAGYHVIPEIPADFKETEARKAREEKRVKQEATPPPTPEQIAASNQRYESYRDASLQRANGIQPVKVVD